MIRAQIQKGLECLALAFGLYHAGMILSYSEEGGLVVGMAPGPAAHQRKRWTRPDRTMEPQNWPPRDFPGGPVVKTLPSNARGCGFDPCLGS